jgi:hypothetical protein
LRVLRVEGLAGSPLVGRVIGHLRERRRKQSRRRQWRLQVKAPGRGCGKACQVDEGVRARGFLRLNMDTRTTPRHERALPDAAPVSHVLAALCGLASSGGLPTGRRASKLGVAGGARRQGRAVCRAREAIDMSKRAWESWSRCAAVWWGTARRQQKHVEAHVPWMAGQQRTRYTHKLNWIRNAECSAKRNAEKNRERSDALVRRAARRTSHVALAGGWSRTVTCAIAQRPRNANHTSSLPARDPRRALTTRCLRPEARSQKQPLVHIRPCSTSCVAGSYAGRCCRAST